MTVLVPIDGSECSIHALEFAVKFSDQYETDLEVVHITDYHTEATENLLERANEILTEAGIDEEVKVITDSQKFRASNRIGKKIVGLIEAGDYEHIVMGHHGTGVVGRAILGSASETVIQAADVPVTTVP